MCPYVNVVGRWRYVYRAIDEHVQVIQVFVSPRRNIAAARTFFTGALAAHGEPDEVVTDLAQALETVIEELIPDAFRNTERYENNRRTHRNNQTHGQPLPSATDIKTIEQYNSAWRHRWLGQFQGSAEVGDSVRYSDNVD
jgi:transposase-like protein